MRRVLAATLALAALALSLALVYVGGVCGAQAVEEAPAGQVAEEPECVRRVHPLALPLVAMALVGVVGVLLSLPGLPLATGVLAMGVGTLFGFSLGLWGAGIAALLVAAGVAAPGRPGWEGRERALKRTAIVAAAIPLPVALITLYAFGGQLPLGLVWVVTLGPMLAWFALLAWVVAPPRPPA